MLLLSCICFNQKGMTTLDTSSERPSLIACQNQKYGHRERNNPAAACSAEPVPVDCRGNAAQQISRMKSSLNRSGFLFHRQHFASGPPLHKACFPTALRYTLSVPSAMTSSERQRTAHFLAWFPVRPRSSSSPSSRSSSSASPLNLPQERSSLFPRA